MTTKRLLAYLAMTIAAAVISCCVVFPGNNFVVGENDENEGAQWRRRLLGHNGGGGSHDEHDSRRLDCHGEPGDYDCGPHPTTPPTPTPPKCFTNTLYEDGSLDEDEPEAEECPGGESCVTIMFDKPAKPKIKVQINLHTEISWVQMPVLASMLIHNATHCFTNSF